MKKNILLLAIIAFSLFQFSLNKGTGNEFAIVSEFAKLNIKGKMTVFDHTQKSFKLAA